MLKHTNNGFPHIRNFQLSSDLKRILWYTKKKSISDAQISFESIVNIVKGQTSSNFKRYPLKMLEDFSFSIYFRDKSNETRTLDLTCKDEREFDLWMIALKALHCHFNKKVINKFNLLNHSSNFMSQVEKGNVGASSKFLFYTDSKPSKSLETFIVCRNFNIHQLANLFLSLCEKVKKMRNQVEEISEKEGIASGETNKEYELVFAEEAIVDDLDTQKSQMIRLFKESERNLAKHLQEYITFISNKSNNPSLGADPKYDDLMKITVELELHLETNLPSNLDLQVTKPNPEFFLKELDINLWKIEIDLENVGDIINRFNTPMNKGILDTLKNLLGIVNK